MLIERGSLPGEPVNAFGIPQATMRCLELAESVGAMAELITFSNDEHLGPIESLNKFAAKIRESRNGGPPLINSVNNSSLMANPFPSSFNTNGASVTLYSSAPPSVTNPTSNPPPAASLVNSPANATSSASSSPLKQHKTISQPSGSAATSVTTSSPSVSTGAATNTPSLANSTLKRKQGDGASPTTGPPEQPPQKRSTRKRGRTGTQTGA